MYESLQASWQSQLSSIGTINQQLLRAIFKKCVCLQMQASLSVWLLTPPNVNFTVLWAVSGCCKTVLDVTGFAGCNATWWKTVRESFITIPAATWQTDHTWPKKKNWPRDRPPPLGCSYFVKELFPKYEELHGVPCITLKHDEWLIKQQWGMPLLSEIPLAMIWSFF